MPLRIDSVTMEPQGNPPTWGVSNALTLTSVAINVTDEISETEKRKCNLCEELSDTFFELSSHPLTSYQYTKCCG